MISALAQDVRFAVRSFLKAPLLAAVALLSLALGIGANTAIVAGLAGAVPARRASRLNRFRCCERTEAHESEASSDASPAPS